MCAISREVVFFGAASDFQSGIFLCEREHLTQSSISSATAQFELDVGFHLLV